ncbi:LOW QUALITY PROTEIN: vitronectin a [Sphaeramia orbicularis]|uniref:LOW QUALITY PROTEIN: vitronectin a n=1 Tax=Sphaeramia orbicularis TaxID=375764 RepID=UPI00117F6E9E|nr:LOW QUALITY PROTEIN: vitronectin [Sphaeramia orbicularis]
MRLRAVLLLALVTHTFAEDESCMGRCENGFDASKTCQCDSMCKYYKSCCSDYEVTCGMMTRGDTFIFAEDDDDVFDSTTPAPSPHHHGRTALGRGPRPTQQSVPDFRPQDPLEVTLQMTKPLQETGPIVANMFNRRTPPMPRSVLGTTEAPGAETTAEMTTTAPVTPATTAATPPTTTEAPDPDAEVCSGRPFDSFMQMKNGSIYAFRGVYFFELDQKSVVPGYPKLIKDVWGIKGPIDAAFTRVNCQGKTYIFKGNQYWRFDDGVLDEDYPRDISVGFDKIPDYVDAAFALPAPGHNGKEKAYFFKGDQYYSYEFLHQPTHEECIGMSERSPSTLFRRYTDVYSRNYERFFSELFSEIPQHHGKHHFIDKDWKGLRSPVNAAMAGRIYVSPLRFPPARNDYQTDQQWGRQQDQQYDQQWGQQWGQQQWGQRRQSRSPFWDSMAERGMAMGQEMAERGMEMGLRLAQRRMEMEERLRQDWSRGWDQDMDQDRRRDGYRQNNRGNYDSRNDRNLYWDFIQRTQPIQSVYFFKGDKYYRVDLRSKRVDPGVPPYPRSIARYWLGCSDPMGAEK